MYKSYQPVLPAANKLLQKRWDEKYYGEHRDKVFTAKPMVDTKAPRSYMHLYLKLKKLQLEEERISTIERDNRILLEKMSYIMRTRGRVDNRNNYESKSLNREKRQRELLRVTRENQDILRRITGRKPEYNHEEWEDDWVQNLNYMDSISQYPKEWWLRKQNTTLRSRSFVQGSARSRSYSRQKSTASRKDEGGKASPTRTASRSTKSPDKRKEETASPTKTESEPAKE